MTRTPPRDVRTEVDEAAERIRKYLEASPNASDTFEAIAHWWLEGVRPEIVRQALARLVAQGVLAAKTLIDGTVIYGSATFQERREAHR